MGAADRLSTLESAIRRAVGAVEDATALRPQDVLPWLDGDALDLLLARASQRDPAALDPIFTHAVSLSADIDLPNDADFLCLIRRSIRNALRFRRCGVPAHTRDPRAELRVPRWHAWARRHGVAFWTPPNSAVSQPVALPPWARDG